MKRPLSISAISWFFIIYSLVTLFPKIYILTSPGAYQGFEKLMTAHQNKTLISVPISYQVCFSFLASIITFTTGILLLKGSNVGRYLVPSWFLCALLFTLLVSGLSHSFYVKIPLAVIITGLQFTPTANLFFSKGTE